jgi:hypothetical protein
MYSKMRPRRRRREQPCVRAVFVEDDDLAVFTSRVFRADDVERAGLEQGRMAVEVPSTNGRMPNGSRAPMSFLVRPTKA